MKAFGLGWEDRIDPTTYTDDGSAYVELHGGLTPSFDETLTLQPDAERSWQETWYPVAGIGGLTAADDAGAVHLTRTDDGLRLRLYRVSTSEGEIIVSDGRGNETRTSLTLSPSQPGDIALPGAQPPVRFEFRPSAGSAWSMGNLFPAADAAQASHLFVPSILRSLFAILR